MLTYPPKYDELYVVSDLHMGGTKNADRDFQIFNRGARLGKLITHLGEQRPKDNICLALNGDIIDSLAEDQIQGYVALDHELAQRILERIYQDPSFTPVWNALEKFIKKPKRHLIFIVGNHDIEFSLPGVEASIRHHLTGDDVEAKSRLVFSTHGSGFACTVGDKRVFCTHGNEVDDWNMVNYDLLGQLGNAMNAGRKADAAKWMPNAGTRLVVDVMNKFKKRYPFVDLLKPEIEPVVSVLLTLDKNALSKINLSDAFPILRDKVRGGLQAKKLLSADAKNFSGVSDETVANEAVERLLGANLKEAISKSQRSQPDHSEDDLLRSAEKAMDQGKSLSDMAEEEGNDGTLGWKDIVAGRIGLIDKVEALRRSLKDWLKDDTTFDIDTKDETYERIIERVGLEVDYVITGHTHLARAIEFEAGRFYFNCGTWIRLLRLTNEVLADDATEIFKKTAWHAFSSGHMSDLDNVKIPGKNGQEVPLLYDRTHVVRISALNGSVTGNLLLVTENDKNELHLSPELAKP